jgi:hypothetical protein
MTLRRPLRLQPLRQEPRSRLYRGTSSRSALNGMLCLEHVLQSLSRSCLSELPSARTAVPVHLYAGSWGSSATAYGRPPKIRDFLKIVRQIPIIICAESRKYANTVPRARQLPGTLRRTSSDSAVSELLGGILVEGHITVEIPSWRSFNVSTNWSSHWRYMSAIPARKR